MGRLEEAIRARIRGAAEFHVPLARHTSFGIGGPARVVIRPADEADLLECLNLAASEGLPLLVLGGGSNLLVRDGGFPGMVLRLNAFQTLEREGTQITAGAGVRVNRLLSFAMRHGLRGLEILTGVPGTVGGAVWGNAGAWGGAVGDRIASVRVVRAGEGAVEIPRAEIPYRYRASGLPAGAVVTRATFGLEAGDSFEIRRRILWYLVQRRATQPVEHRSAGSVFRNPPEDSAGRLVQMVGLKGTRVGQAMISHKHANFIVNLGGARAADVLALVDLMQTRVREMSGIELELELQVVGVDAA